MVEAIILDPNKEIEQSIDSFASDILDPNKLIGISESFFEKQKDVLEGVASNLYAHIEITSDQVGVVAALNVLSGRLQEIYPELKVKIQANKDKYSGSDEYPYAFAGEIAELCNFVVGMYTLKHSI